ncbi:MAG: hypothetical protein MZV63_06765 [Marinilabiliales bacterium]|nr:hypothetical protein [Marinilabiliales bacterium]
MVSQRASASAGTPLGVPSASFPLGEPGDPVAAEDDGLRVGTGRHIGEIDGEGAVMVEPVVPPGWIARSGLPEIIRIRCEARLREERHVQVERAGRGDGFFGVLGERIPAGNLRENHRAVARKRPGWIEDHPITAPKPECFAWRPA